MLYNGKATYPEKSILKLSDMFFKNENASSCEYEWTATVLNINNGMNDLLKNACLALRSYADFVSLIRYNKDILHQNNQDAIENAINYTLQKKDVLYEILSRSKAEVTAMFLSEFNQEIHNDNLKAEGREEGRAEGRAEGLAEGLADKLKSLAELVNEGHIPYDVALRKANVPEEEFKKYL